MSSITHAVACPACGRDTYAWERDCHHCGTNRWDYTESDQR